MCDHDDDHLWHTKSKHQGWGLQVGCPENYVNSAVVQQLIFAELSVTNSVPSFVFLRWTWDLSRLHKLGCEQQWTTALYITIFSACDSRWWELKSFQHRNRKSLHPPQPRCCSLKFWAASFTKLSGGKAATGGGGGKSTSDPSDRPITLGTKSTSHQNLIFLKTLPVHRLKHVYIQFETGAQVIADISKQ